MIYISQFITAECVYQNEAHRPDAAYGETLRIGQVLYILQSNQWRIQDFDRGRGGPNVNLGLQIAPLFEHCSWSQNKYMQ